MSLSTRGAGLFDTHVTWLDVQNELQKTLEAEAIFGEKKKIQRIGEGNGFLSRMGLINPDWQGDNVLELPNKFVVKILSALSLEEFSFDSGSSATTNTFNIILASRLPGFHNAEVTVYKIIETYGEGRIPAPKIFCSCLHSESSNGFLVMEYLENLEDRNGMDTISVEEARQILRAVARLQAISFKITEEEKRSIPKDVFTTFVKPKLESSVDDTLRDFKIAGDGYFTDLLPELKSFTEVLLSKANMEALDKWNQDQDLPDVIVHDDLWMANILWTREDEKLKLRAIVDYQTVNIGCCAVDLCATLINLGRMERRMQTEQLIKEFYVYLEQEMEGNVPFNLEKLHRSFDRFFPVCAFRVFKWAAPYIDLAKKNSSEQELKAIKSNLRMLMEEMMTYQKKSLSVYDRNH